jgi:hypothetical protein
MLSPEERVPEKEKKTTGEKTTRKIPVPYSGSNYIGGDYSAALGASSVYVLGTPNDLECIFFFLRAKS